MLHSCRIGLNRLPGDVFCKERDVSWRLVASMFRVGNAKLSKWITSLYNFWAGKAQLSFVLTQLPLPTSAGVLNAKPVPTGRTDKHWQKRKRAANSSRLLRGPEEPATRIHYVNMKFLCGYEASLWSRALACFRTGFTCPCPCSRDAFKGLAKSWCSLFVVLFLVCFLFP